MASNQSTAATSTSKRDFAISPGEPTLKEQAAVVSDDVCKLAQVASNRAAEQLDPIREYVQQHPVRSLLYAAGAGMLFNMLFMRR